MRRTPAIGSAGEVGTAAVHANARSHTRCVAVAIVAGVLVALAVDGWRTSRNQHALELQYADRLRADLQRDTGRFRDFERVALAKKASTLLALLKANGAPPHLGDPRTAMESLNYWQFIALPEAQSTVFHEMETTGNLALIRDPALRSGFATHYALHDLLSGILARPLGPYRELIAASVDGDLSYQWLTGRQATDSVAVVRGIRALMRSPRFRAAVNAELSYTGSLLFYLRESRIRAESLLTRLNTAYPN